MSEVPDKVDVPVTHGPELKVAPPRGQIEASVGHSSEAKPVTPPGQIEAAEAEPKLSLQVEGPCKNPAGNYVGLSKSQRDKLGVDVGQTVELRRAGGVVVGIYTVGLGSKELIARPEAFSANGINPGEQVEVVKYKPNEAKLETLALSFGLESDPKHAKRSEIIAQRFGKEGYDGNAYISLPTPVAKAVTGQSDSKVTVASIALGRVKIGGVEKTLPIVPTGTQFGITSKAAGQLNIPTSGFSKANFYVNAAGVLVIDRLE